MTAAAELQPSPLNVQAPEPLQVCIHHADPANCDTCLHRRAAAYAADLPDLASGPGRHPLALTCGCCPLPIEPGEPTATTPGGETVHAGCAS